jgi:hypothetical protein
VDLSFGSGGISIELESLILTIQGVLLVTVSCDAGADKDIIAIHNLLEGNARAIGGSGDDLLLFDTRGLHFEYISILSCVRVIKIEMKEKAITKMKETCIRGNEQFDHAR